MQYQRIYRKTYYKRGMCVALRIVSLSAGMYFHMLRHIYTYISSDIPARSEMSMYFSWNAVQLFMVFIYFKCT